MKLRNKKTGEVYNACGIIFGESLEGLKKTQWKTLEEFNEDWEDYEEPKEFWYIDDAGVIQIDQVLSSEINMRKSIGNYFETKEEAENAVEKLKAWKRLKDKGFEFHGHNALGVGEITLSLDFEDMDYEGEIGQLRHDLDLLFGGEE